MALSYGDGSDAGFGEYSEITSRECPVPPNDQSDIFAPVSEAATNRWCDCMFGTAESLMDEMDPGGTSPRTLLTKCKEYSFWGYPWTVGGKADRGLPANIKGWFNAWNEARRVIEPLVPGQPTPKQPVKRTQAYDSQGNPIGTGLAAGSAGLLLAGAAILGYVLLKK